MALNSTVQPVLPVQNESTPSVVPDALLSMVLLSMFAANQSKKGMAKLKRKLMWDTFKLKIKSVFSKNKEISTRTLLIIIVVALALILLLAVSWQTALILLLAGILVVLLVKN